MPKQHVTLAVSGLKVACPLKADQIPLNLVPPDGPAGEPTIALELPGRCLVVAAKLNGKNLRRNLKTIAEHGAENVAVVLQGTLRPPVVAGGPFVLEGAGLQVNVKTPPQPKPGPVEAAPKEGG